MSGRIVVGIDGSSGSAAALQFALEEAAMRGARVEAILAWHWPVMAAEGGLPADFDPAGWAQSALDETLSGVATGDTSVEGRIVEGHAAAVLVDAAADADLLVVGTRGHGGFTGLLLGSVSQHCVSHAPCPVVVVPPLQGRGGR